MPSANEKLIKSLEAARAIIDDAILVLNGTRQTAPIKKKIAVDAGDVVGLPDHILALRKEGFFQSPRSGRDVHEKLQETYSCSADRVAMALLRLQRKKFLRKTTKQSGEKKQVAYVW